MTTTRRTPATSQRAVSAAGRCECGGRIERTTNGNGAVVDQCVRCGAKPGHGRPLANVTTGPRAGAKCTAIGCPGHLDPAGVCSCCVKRKAWTEAHMPKRHCEICSGEIGGRGVRKYCEACKPLAAKAKVAQWQADHEGSKKNRGA